MMKLLEIDWRNTLGDAPAVDGLPASSEMPAVTPAAIAVETSVVVIAAAVAVLRPALTKAAEICGAKYAIATATAMIATAFRTLPIDSSCRSGDALLDIEGVGMIWIAALALLSAQAEPYEGELKEHLRTPVKATMESAKRSYDLEICVADVLTALGTPTALRSGPDDVVIAASFPTSNAYIASATIIRVGQGSRVELRVRGKGWDDRLRTRLQACM